MYGCETCVELCPEVFAFDEDAELAKASKPEAEDECVEEIIDYCPVACIYWEENYLPVGPAKGAFLTNNLPPMPFGYFPQFSIRTNCDRLGHQGQ